MKTTTEPLKQKASLKTIFNTEGRIRLWALLVMVAGSMCGGASVALGAMTHEHGSLAPVVLMVVFLGAVLAARRGLRAQEVRA